MRTDEEWCVRLFERAESFQDLPEWVENRHATLFRLEVRRLLKRVLPLERRASRSLNRTGGRRRRRRRAASLCRSGIARVGLHLGRLHSEGVSVETPLRPVLGGIDCDQTIANGFVEHPGASDASGPGQTATSVVADTMISGGPAGPSTPTR